MSALRILLFLVMVPILQSCSVHDQAEAEISDISKVAAEQKLPAKKPKGRQLPHIHFVDRPFLGTAGTSELTLPLPREFERSGGISVEGAYPMSLQEITELLSTTTGIPFFADNRSFTRVASAAQSSDSTGNIFTQDPRSSATARQIMRLRPDFRGKLSVFLDMLAAHFDITWKYNGHAIELSRYVIRTYPLSASSAKTETTFTAGNSGGDQSSSQRISATHVAEFQKDLENMLSAFVTEGTFNIAPSTGVVTVVASPRIHADVEAYIKQINQLFNTRIAIEVEAYFISRSSGDDYGVNISGIIRSAASGISGGVTSVTNSVVGNLGTITILPSASGYLGDLSGSEFIFRALSEQTEVADHQTTSTVTQHGSPVPISIANKRDIVRNITTTTTEGVTQTSVESETIATGFSLFVIPRIVGGNQIQLTLSFIANELESLTPFTTSGQTIQLASINERQMNHDLTLGNGETLVLTGFRQNRANSQKEGIGEADFFFLGGRSAGGVAKEELVLVVSARTL